MGSGQIFNVLAEFRFDIGQAVINSQKLENATKAISQAADNALVSFQALSLGIVGGIGLGNLGLLEILKTSVSISESFQRTAQGFSSLFAGNLNALSGSVGTFSDRLNSSRAILNDIVGVAGKVHLSAGGLASATQSIAQPLITKGLAGTNLSAAIHTAVLAGQAGRGLGLSASQAGSQAAGILKDETGSELFKALVGSTDTFKRFADHAGRFKALDTPKQLELLNKGLGELSTKLGDTGQESLTLADEMDRLKDMVLGLGGILRPIGDAILPPLLKLFREFNDQVGSIGKDLGERLGAILTPLLEDPKKFLLSLATLRHLGSDVKESGHIVGVFGVIITGMKVFNFAMGQLGLTLRATLGGALGGVASVLGVVWRGALAPLLGFLLTGANLVRFVTFGFAALQFVLSKLIAPFLFLTFVMQTISRAMEMAKINDILNLAKLAPKFAELAEKVEVALMNLMQPFEMIMNAVAEWISPLFETTTYLNILMPLFEGFADLLGMIGEAMVLASATFQGIVWELASAFDSLRGGHLPDMGKMTAAYDAGVDEYIEKHMRQVQGGAHVSNQITNIGKVEIKNDFKENIEPDRIAFTMKDQLLKAAQNPTQSRGRSLHTAFAGR